jgi:hypothetical protein
VLCVAQLENKQLQPQFFYIFRTEKTEKRSQSDCPSEQSSIWYSSFPPKNTTTNEKDEQVGLDPLGVFFGHLRLVYKLLSA